MKKTLHIVVTSLILLWLWGVSGVFAQSGAGRPFITKWQGEAGKELKISIVGTYKMVIKDGNGNEKLNETVTVENSNHPYVFTPTEDGTYTVEAGPEGVKGMSMVQEWSLNGKFFFTSNDKLLEVVQFGTVKWKWIGFSWCENMTFAEGIDTPDLSEITSMNSMFEDCRSFNQPLNNWDVSKVTNMGYMFRGCSSFNQPLDNWDVSKVDKMHNMFMGCSAFNQPLNNWDVSKVDNMEKMFKDCSAFNQPLDNWDVSKVTNMKEMFKDCSAFNQPLDNWDVSKVTNMGGMFKGCSSFNQPLEKWNVSNVYYMGGMFSGCSAFNQPLEKWNLREVRYITSMFSGCSAFNQPLEKWNLREVTKMDSMFNGCSSFNQPLEKWNVSKVWSMKNMFSGCSTFNQPLEKWDVSNVTNMERMFSGCSSFNQPLEKWYVGDVTNMVGMFSGCSSFNQPLEKWSVYDVTNMVEMFSGCSSFNQPLEKWNVSKVYHMGGMFMGCSAFNQPLEKWNVSKVRYMNNMFNSCSSFNQPLEKWDVSKVEQMEGVFSGCSSFNQPLEKWNVSNVYYMGLMFNGCSSFNQPLEKWDVSKVTEMRKMFRHCAAFNQPLDNWNVSNVTHMGWMFNGCSAFNRPLGSWKIKTAVGGLSTTAMSPSNYSQTLVGWAEQTDITDNLDFWSNVKGLVYNDEGKAAHDKLIAKGWKLNDDIYQSSGVAITPRFLPLALNKEFTLPLEKWGVEDTEAVTLSTDTGEIISYELTADKKGVHIKGLKEGTCKLTATIAAKEGVHEVYTSTCEIEVYIPIERITITPARKTLKVGEEFTFTANFFPENATKREVKWESGNSSIFTVDDNGKVTAKKKARKCTLSAKVEEYKREFYGTCEITVGEPSNEGNNGSGENNGGGNSGGNNGGNNGGGDNNGGNPTTFSVTLTQPANGKIEIEGHATETTITVAKDTELTVKATPDEGYKLKEIVVNGQKLDGTTFVVKAATTVTALFEKETFAVTTSVNNVACGSITLTGASDLTAVPYGTELTVKVTPNEGYKLKTLKANDEHITKTLAFTVKAATTVMAIFESKQGDNNEPGGAVEDALLAGISVAPNPFTAQLRILNPEGVAAHYELVNAAGVVVRSGALSGSETLVDTEALSAGVYFVHLEIQNGARKSLMVSK